MITGALIGVLGGVVRFVVGLLPGFTLPGWFTDLCTYVASACAGIGGLANYFPVGSLVIGLVFIFAVYSSAFLFRVFRIVLSNLTGGGGAV